MRLPSFRRINFNDYAAEYKEFIQQLSIPLNNGFEVINNALNKNVSLKDNVLCDVKDVSIEVDANGAPKKEIALTVSLQGNPVILGSQVIIAINQTNPTVYPTAGVFISFTQTSRGIIINHVAGLPANNLFLVRVVLYA